MADRITLFKKIWEIVAIIFVGIMICTLLLLACNADLVTAYTLLVNGVFGNSSSFAEIFVKACPLVLVSLGCAVAFRTGFFNIGAEGQFYVGAICSAMFILSPVELPGSVKIISGMIIAFLSGGLWAFFAAFLKSKFDISEIIVTIMLNYIAINFLGYAIRGFMMDKAGNVPQSAKIPMEAQLPVIIQGTRFHVGIIIAFLLVIVIWLILDKTVIGYEMKAVGLNARASYCCGISVTKNIILSAFISGGLAGVAGIVEVIAIQKKLLEGISAECGYTAVLISLIAFNKPIGAAIVSVIYAAMKVGAGSMQRQLGVPSAIVDILIGAAVILILIKEVFSIEKMGEVNE